MEQEPVRKKEKRTARKSVSFQFGCKLHDGLSERKLIFERLVESYFLLQKEISEPFVLKLTGYDVEKANDLLLDFLDLISRLKEESMKVPCKSSSVAVLPFGGGSALRVFPDHFPALVQLAKIVENTSQRLQCVSPDFKALQTKLDPELLSQIKVFS